jgi:hypothetical protein
MPDFIVQHIVFRAERYTAFQMEDRNSILLPAIALSAILSFPRQSNGTRTAKKARI